MKYLWPLDFTAGGTGVVGNNPKTCQQGFLWPKEWWGFPAWEVPAQPESCCLRQEKSVLWLWCHCDWLGPPLLEMGSALFGEGRQSTAEEMAVMQNSKMKYCCGKLGVQARKAPWWGMEGTAGVRNVASDGSLYHAQGRALCLLVPHHHTRVQIRC